MALSDDQLLDLYLAELKFANRRPSTIKTRRYYLARFSKVIGFREATSEKIQDWLATLDLAPATLNLYLTTYNCFYDFMVKKKKLTGIKKNPATKDDIVRPKTRRGEPHPIREDHLARALKRANPTMKAWLLIGAREGFRCIEIANLRRQDIRADRGMLHVESGKGDKPRDVPLHPDVFTALNDLDLPESGRLWPLMTNEKMSRKIGDFLHKHECMTEADTPATAHALRHRFGTDILAAAGGNLRIAQEALGHADPGVTAIYTKVNWGEMSEAVAKLGHKPEEAA